VSLFAKLIKDESGQGMVEYGLIIAVVAVLLVVALGAMREEIAAVFDRISDALSGAGN